MIGCALHPVKQKSRFFPRMDHFFGDGMQLSSVGRAHECFALDKDARAAYTAARMSEKPKSYKESIFLPDTTFPMRGDLTTKEPQRLEKWESEGLYERIVARRKAQGAPSFVLHDGPPFANGDVHMGTALK